MADEKYLKRRGETWFFEIAVPREIRGKYAKTKTGKPIDKIVKSLKTRDIRTAQTNRYRLLDDYTERFRRCAGDISLTRAEIDNEARRIYADTLAGFDSHARKHGPAQAEPEREGDDPEIANLEIQMNLCEEAIEADDFDFVASELDAVCKRTGSAILRGTETHQLLGHALLSAVHAALAGRIAALRERSSAAPETFVRGGIDRVTLQPLASLPRPKIRNNLAGTPFQKAALEYIADIQRDKNAKLTEQTRGQHEMAFRLFGQYCNDASLSAIDRTIAGDFLQAISKLPPHWGRSSATKKLTIWELLKKFEDNKDQLSNKTLNRYASSLSGLFKWARRRGYFEGANPFSEQSRPKPRKGTTGWLPYSIDELNKVFSSSTFLEVDGDDRIRPKKHDFQTALLWVPLIALFSGMRLGEICQLKKADLKTERKIPFFNVTDVGDEQSIKTEAGIRHVPLHSELIKCGLLEYATALPDGQLFPGLTPGGPDGKLSWYFTRAYTKFRRDVDVDRARISFHSFRKNVVTALDNEGVPQGDLAALIGHERGFTFETYSKGLELERLKGITEKIEYPGLRLEHLQLG